MVGKIGWWLSPAHWGYVVSDAYEGDLYMSVQKACTIDRDNMVSFNIIVPITDKILDRWTWTVQDRKTRITKKGVVIGSKCVCFIIAKINMGTYINRDVFADECGVVGGLRGGVLLLGVKEGGVTTVEGRRKLNGGITGKILIR